MSVVDRVLVRHQGAQDLALFESENEPTNPKLWEQAKKLAKENFDVYPSALANNWTVKWYDRKGGEWWLEEGTLHNWFGKSKSKDGKPGWVQSDGSPCANEPGEKGTPKCYSSRRLAGLKKTKEGQKKIRSADARKSREDPGQQSKSGASKPTMVRTFKDKKDYKKYPSGDYKKNEQFEPSLKEATKDIKGSGSGKKDACYNKVKSRYRVWPSAYASGALVKCRKVGAANWGNSKKEDFEWVSVEKYITEARLPAMNGNMYMVTFNWRGKFMGMRIFFPTMRQPSRKEVEQALDKVYPSSILRHFVPVDPSPDGGYLNAGVNEEVELEEGTPAWQRKEGKSESGGLNKKGVESYRRENPGSKLKTAVTKDPSKLKKGSKAAKRRLSFCRRMKGMKKKLTSAKTARDPDSRINKSLRKWNC